MSMMKIFSINSQLSLNGNAQPHSESMMSQTNTAILGYDASTACMCSTHPLIKHWLGVARDAATPSVLFVAR